MDAFSALLARDFKIALRSGGTWLLGLVFFASFLTLVASGVGFATRAALAPLAASDHDRLNEFSALNWDSCAKESFD